MKFKLSALFLAAMVSGGAICSAQDASPAPEKDECAPRLQSEGKWKCRLNTVRAECPTGRTVALSEIWKIADGAEQAKVLIRAKYREFQNLRIFAEWFACQGLHFSSSYRPLNERSILPTISHIIYIGYTLEKGNIFNETWREFSILPAYGANFKIYLDDFGQIEKLEYIASTL